MTARYKASPELEAFILAMAPPHYPCEHAPQTLAELRELVAKHAGQCIPVWSGGSEHTIFSSPAVNYAFRAWHDSFHLVLNAEFDAAGEALVEDAAWWLAFKLRDSVPTSVLDREVLRIEAVGQLQHEAEHGKFPHDQAAFTQYALDHGIEPAVAKGPW